jgi:hypothetical protein
MKFWEGAIKIKLLYLILGFLVLQTCFITKAWSQDFNLELGRKKGAFTFDMVKNLIIIPVYINHKGPFNFILDTGVGPMIITNPKLKDTLGLKDLRTIKITGFGAGDDIEAFIAKSDRVVVHEAFVEDLRTIVLKEDIFSLSSYLGKEISGLIGYDFFNSFIVKVSYPAKRVSYSIPSKHNGRIKGEKIPIEIIENKPYLTAKIQSETLGKIEVKLIIDCGASHALSLETFQNQFFPPSPTNIIGNLGVGLNGEISGLVGRIPMLSIGSYSFKGVLTNFPKYTDVAAKSTFKDRNGNLGSEILRRFNITYDYKNNAIYLKKNENFNRTFEHDMSGIEFYIASAPSNPYIIARIEPNSAGETAGLLINDEIMAINFKKINEYTLDEIAAILKSGNDRTVIMEIYRDNNTYVKLLKLKKRI